MPNGDSTRKWLAWLAPSVVLGLCSVAFSVGLWVGRNEMKVEIVEIRQEIQSHRAIPRHSGALGTEVLELRFDALNRRLDRIENHIEELQ